MGRALTTLLERFHQHLSGAMREALAAAMAASEQGGLELYLVGGGVRDLLLDTAHDDVDLVVEGDALLLSRAIGKRLRASVVEHPRFGTAVIQGPEFRLDLARARTESYVRPGALPAVRPAKLAEDLARRDFTINAMAVCLVGTESGALIDPHGGRRDIAAGRIRTIHDESFQDDATRILRAIRYAGRLGFRLARTTAACLRRDAGYLDTVSGTRLRREFEYIAAEPQVGEIVQLAARYGVLQAVHPVLVPDARGRRAAARLPELPASHRDAVLFCLLLANAPALEAEHAIGRLAMTGRQAAAVSGLLAIKGDEAELSNANIQASRVAELLSGRPTESEEAFALIGRRKAGCRVRRFLDEWRWVRPRLSGDDVKVLGVSYGPAVGSMLRTLRAARLDGELRTKADEVAFVRRRVGAKTETGRG